MNHQRIFNTLIATLILLLSNCTSSLVVISSDESIAFTILQINDVYEIAPLEGGKVAGLARVASLLHSLEEENPNTIAVMAGDFLSPTFMNTLKLDDGERIAGLQMIEALNAMGLDYATFGNHEFDLKTGELLEKRLAQSKFTYMTSNAFFQEAEGSRRFRQGTKEIEDYSIFEVKTADGKSMKVAIVGVVLPFNKPDYVTYTDVNLSFGKAAKRAAEEADVVLGLTHLNIWEDEELAAVTTTDIPLFMGGHEHQHLSRFVNETAITKADANAKTVYVHRFTYFPAADVCKVSSELVNITDEMSNDPVTQAVVVKWENKINDMIKGMGYDPKQVLTYINPPLLATEAVIRSQQTNYGRLTNKAFEYAWPAAHAYVFNSGSLRLDDNLSGDITAYDILRSFPYGGPIVQIEIQGNQLQQLLDISEDQNKGAGGYLQHLFVKKEGTQWTIRDQPLLVDQTYRIVMPAFLAAGREANLEFLGELPKTEKEKLSVNGREIKNDIRDILINYLMK